MGVPMSDGALRLMIANGYTAFLASMRQTGESSTARISLTLTGRPLQRIYDNLDELIAETFVAAEHGADMLNVTCKAYALNGIGLVMFDLETELPCDEEFYNSWRDFFHERALSWGFNVVVVDAT